MAIEFSASADYGQTGQYIARITGRAPRVSFAREFLGRKSGKRNDITTALVDEPGLYEVVNRTRKGRDIDHWIVVEREGELRRIRSDEEDFLAIAKRFDGGETLDQIVGVEVVDRDPAELERHPDWSQTKLVYTIRNKVEAKKAVAAATIDTAVAAIVSALDALPTAQQKQALAAAKARLFPKAELPKPALPNPNFAPTHIITRNGVEIPVRKDHINDCALYTEAELFGVEDVESHWELSPDGSLLFDGRTPMGVVTIRKLD